jgi:hypothetical protein
LESIMWHVASSVKENLQYIAYWNSFEWLSAQDASICNKWSDYILCGVWKDRSVWSHHMLLLYLYYPTLLNMQCYSIYIENILNLFCFTLSTFWIWLFWWPHFTDQSSSGIYSLFYFS